MTSNSKLRLGKNQKSRSQYKRSLRLESLEERALLSVTPLSSDEYADLRGQYAEFDLPENMADLNVITLDLAEGDDLSTLKGAITTAGTTTQSDLIVVRTTDTANTIKYTAADDELSINIDASEFGSVTIVGLGSKPLTLDADQQCSVMTISGENTVANLGGLTIQNGFTDYGGGGIYNDGELTVANSTITGNTASSSDGGGIYNYYSGTLTVTNSMISGNTADDGGGVCNDGTLTVTNSTISGNTAFSYGGGLDNDSDSGELTVTNSTITGNTAENGGGIDNYRGTLTVTNCTIAGNTASSNGSGFYAPTGSTTINNSIIIDVIDSGTISGSNNLSSFTDWDGSNNIEYDSGRPLFVDAANGDYHLVEDSQAIDNGSNVYAKAADLEMTSTDIYGNPRYNHSFIDIGAAEFQSDSMYSAKVTTLNDSFDFYDDEWSLREAIYYATDYPTIYNAWGVDGQIDLKLGELVIDKPLIIAPWYYVIDAGQNSRAFYVCAGTEEQPVVLNGITIQNGKTDENGGGIYLSSGTLSVINCTITGNTAEGQGGGIYSTEANLTVTDSRITENSAFSGGGIYSYDGTLTVANSTIAENTVTEEGGGIYSSEATLTVTQSTISQNTASQEAYSAGGGIYSTGTLTVDSSVISGNTARFGGGIHCGETLISNSTISENTAFSSSEYSLGGGIFIDSGALTVINSMITRNTVSGGDSSFGGAIYNYGSFTITNCTIAGNTVSVGDSSSDDGIYSSASGTNTATINNSIVVDAIFIDEGTISGSNNLSAFTDWASGSDNLEYDPTIRLFAEAEYGNYRLVTGAQAINAGNNALAVDASGQEITHDMDNLPRIMYDTVDIGAYEYRNLVSPTLSASVRGTIVTFSWEADPNASEYYFEYDDGWLFTGETSFSFDGVINKEYTARVAAMGGGDYFHSDLSEEKKITVPPIGAKVDGKKVTVSWVDDDPSADTVRYRVANTGKWTTKKLKAGVTTFTFNGAVGTEYEIEVLRNQLVEDVLQVTAVVFDQPKLQADKAAIKDDRFQVNVTNYTAKNLAANATQAIVTVNGVQRTFDIENQEGSAELEYIGTVTFSNGLFTFTDMNNNTQYKVQVAFTDGLSVSTASNLSVKTLKTMYHAPEITSATAVSDTSIEVEWETSFGKGTWTPAQKYTVQYSLDGVKWTNATTGATGNSFTIQKLKGGNMYQVRVMATKDSAFEASEPSDVLTAETLALPVTALVKPSVTDDTFRVNVTNYQTTNLTKAAAVNVTTDKFGTAEIALNDGTGSAIFDGGMTVAFENGALTFTNTPSNTQMKVQVSFALDACTTALSKALTVKTTIAPYGKPTLTNVTAVSSTSVTVEWETVHGKNSPMAAQYYTVQYSLDGQKWTNATTKATGNSFTIQKLKPGTQYLIAVLATKDQWFNASEPSDAELVTTLA